MTMHQTIDPGPPVPELTFTFWKQSRGLKTGKLRTIKDSFTAPISEIEIWDAENWRAILQMTQLSGFRNERLLILVPKELHNA